MARLEEQAFERLAVKALDGQASVIPVLLFCVCIECIEELGVYLI